VVEYSFLYPRLHQRPPFVTHSRRAMLPPRRHQGLRVTRRRCRCVVLVFARRCVVSVVLTRVMRRRAAVVFVRRRVAVVCVVSSSRGVARLSSSCGVAWARSSRLRAASGSHRLCTTLRCCRLRVAGRRPHVQSGLLSGRCRLRRCGCLVAKQSGAEGQREGGHTFPRPRKRGFLSSPRSCLNGGRGVKGAPA
jgi:hypothetical protein